MNSISSADCWCWY